MQRTDMKTLRQILRYRHEFGVPQIRIAEALGVSTGGVSNLLARVRSAGLSWPLPEDLDDAALRALLYPPREPLPSDRHEPDWGSLAGQVGRKRKKRAPRVTRQLLWREHLEEAERAGKTPYGRSRCFERLSEERARTVSPDQVDMRFDYEPGDHSFTDFAGKTVPVTTRTGIVMPEIFVGCLGLSHLTYAEAVPDQSLRSWTGAHRRIFEAWGGVTRCLTIDNLKAGVSAFRDGEPVITEAFAEFGRHYGVDVVPARRNRPKDKAKVEKSVDMVSTQILAALRDQTFFSLEALNAAIRQRLVQLNATPMARTGKSRTEVFDACERAALRPLPRTPWEYRDRTAARVGPDGHVHFRRNLYSVHWKHLGAAVDVKSGERSLDIHLESTGERIATHPLLSGRNQYRTRPEHMTSAHRAVRDIRSPGYGQTLRRRMAAVGPHALAWAEQAFASRDFEEQAYRSVRGVVELAASGCNPYSRDDIDAACRHASALGRFTYGFIRSHLKTVQALRPTIAASETAEPVEPIAPHGNIRGAEYYRGVADGQAGGDRTRSSADITTEEEP